MAELLWYSSAVLYSRLYGFFHDYFKLNLPKLGFLLGKVREGRIIKVQGVRYWFTPKLKSSYGRMLGGSFNEKETHIFIDRVLAQVGLVDLFIDVGSNIGEFLLPAGSSPEIRSVIGFEPNGICVEASRKSVKLNGISNVEIRRMLIADTTGERPFDLSSEGANSGSLFAHSGAARSMVECSTIDVELKGKTGVAIMVIDVEGAELLVLKGAQEFLKINLPLVIFEYNFVSRRHFTLNEISGTLPADYEIFRLRSDGMLDKSLGRTWNCVAISRESSFKSLLGRLVAAKN